MKNSILYVVSCILYKASNGVSSHSHDTRYGGHDTRGFTLIEMIVAIALFAVVMVVSVGALLSLTGANRKAQALQSVMNNLNIAIDGVVRNTRMGTQFHCGIGSFVGTYGADDCPAGGTGVTFTCNPDSSTCAGANVRWAYAYDDGTQGLCGAHALCLCKTMNASSNSCPAGGWTRLTAPEVSIADMKFFVVGATPGKADTDNYQPKLVIVISGQAGGQNTKTKTSFHIEATAVQRQLDLLAQ